MAISRLYINPKQTGKNGKVLIYCLVQINGKTLKVNTGIHVEPENFDNVKGRIKGTSKITKDENLIIDRCLSTINQIFVRYKLQNRPLTPDLFLREYQNPSIYIDFYAYMEKKIIERVKNKEIGETSGVHHKVLVNKLKEFKMTLSFTEIDLKFINSFKNWCRISKKNSVNTIHKGLGYFKAYLNIAKREEIINVNPFENFQLKRVDVQRCYLTEAELTRLVNCYEGHKLTDNLHLTLRHFIFMCLTGLRISDFIRLKRVNIEEDSLKFIPHKTSSKKQIQLHIPLVDQARKIVKDEGSETQFLFNAISEQKMNYHLKEIAKQTGIKKEISNHAARHTFATLFLDKTSDVATLQKLLGHSKIEETMGYVHISNKKIDLQMFNFNNSLKFNNSL